MGNKEWGNIGGNYIRSLIALGFQGVFMMMCLGIYSVLVSSIEITDINSLIPMVGYLVLLVVTMRKSGTLARGIVGV